MLFPVNNSVICIIIISVISISCGPGRESDIEPFDLRCEYSINPISVENSNPELSWILKSEMRNQKQSSYRILVASSEEYLDKNIGDLWDSHEIASDESVHIKYRGATLVTGMCCWWKVCVWDKNRIKSDWSEKNSWKMGLLNKEDWKAKWISYECQSAPLFRKEFEIEKELKEANVCISGLGYYELRVNGVKVGDHVLDPAQTDYEQRTFYVVYDVTDLLKKGENAIGIMLGNGWYNQASVNHGKYGWNDVVYGKPMMIFQMHLLFSDGTEKFILSDNTWKASSGPIISNNIYAGEVYDARLEKDRWDTPGYDDSAWDQVMSSEGPGGKLVSQKIPPIKKIKTIHPVNVKNPKSGIYVFDMGQNFAGWVKLKVDLPAGTAIKLRFAESIFKDGMIDPASTGVYATDVVQTDMYICRGKGLEQWEPHFTYHGFRYVEMTGFPCEPALENIEGVIVHTSVEKRGEFSSSDTLLNKLHHTALRTELSNLHGIPTDCPHRERCGWLGDAFLTSDMTIYNFDMALFWSKFIDDIETSRRGKVPPNIAPGRRYGGSDPDWGAAFIQLPWNMYLYYGDKTIISDHYSGMSLFMNFLDSIAVDNIIYSGIGSLFSPGRIRASETPVEFTSSLLYYFCTEVMSRMARVIGKEHDAEKFSRKAQDIRISFNSKFYNINKKSYWNQEKNSLALAFGLVPEGEEESVADNLNESVIISGKGHVSTGIFGSRYIYETLSRYGYGESVITMFNKKTFPGFGYLFSRGATTFWEHWGELTFEDNTKPGNDRSRNHPFQGGFDVWFYNGIAGILPDPENPGFKHIILKPQIISSVNFAEAEYNSIYGIIKSQWINAEDKLYWLVSIPANTSATAYIPTQDPDSVLESGVPASSSVGVKYLRTENGQVLYELSSGNYEFLIKK